MPAVAAIEQTQYRYIYSSCRCISTLVAALIMESILRTSDYSDIIMYFVNFVTLIVTSFESFVTKNERCLYAQCVV